MGLQVLGKGLPGVMMFCQQVAGTGAGESSPGRSIPSICWDGPAIAECPALQSLRTSAEKGNPLRLEESKASKAQKARNDNGNDTRPHRELPTPDHDVLLQDHPEQVQNGHQQENDARRKGVSANGHDSPPLVGDSTFIISLVELPCISWRSAKQAI
jgi:hypothetical protein